MAITVNLFAKSDYVSRDGTVPIYLRLTIHRKVYPPFKLGYRVKPGDWDETTRKIKDSNPLAGKVNVLLSRELLRAEEVLVNHELSGRALTYESFYNEYSGFNPYCFYALAADYLHVGKGTFSKSYADKVGFVVGKVKKFRATLLIHDINYDFLKAYQYWLVNERGNGKNTIYSNFRIIRRILKHGVKKKLLKENPFNDYKLEKVKTEREVLTVPELQQYERLLCHDLPYYLQKVNCWFLLACYSGRRYSDLVDFNKWEFFSEYIRITANKKAHNRDEKKVVLIYLNAKIRRVVELIRINNYEPLTNTKANKFLHELTRMTGIRKHITFHCARHTFSNINKKLNADLALRRDLLGHDNINSTMTYDHTDEEMMKEQMLKWDTLSIVH